MPFHVVHCRQAIVALISTGAPNMQPYSVTIESHHYNQSYSKHETWNHDPHHYPGAVHSVFLEDYFVRSDILKIAWKRVVFK